MAALGNPDALTSGGASARITSFGSNVNLKTLSAGGGITPGSACRRIRINAGSNVALGVIFDSGSVDTWPGLNQGDLIDAEIATITNSGTTATDITVFW